MVMEFPGFCGALRHGTPQPYRDWLLACRPGLTLKPE